MVISRLPQRNSRTGAGIRENAPDNEDQDGGKKIRYPPIFTRISAEFMIAASSVIAGLVSLLTDGVSGFMIAALRAIAGIASSVPLR